MRTWVLQHIKCTHPCAYVLITKYSTTTTTYLKDIKQWSEFLICTEWEHIHCRLLVPQCWALIAGQYAECEVILVDFTCTVVRLTIWFCIPVLVFLLQHLLCGCKCTRPEHVSKMSEIIPGYLSAKDTLRGSTTWHWYHCKCKCCG